MDDLFVPDLSPSPDAPLPSVPNLTGLLLPPIRSVRRPTVIGHVAALRDIDAAFRQADVALRQAREALRNDAIISSRPTPAGATNVGNNHGYSRNGNVNATDVVDLTTISSDTSNEDPEVQWSATRHPNDPQRGSLTGLGSRAADRPLPHGSGFGLATSLGHIRPYQHYVNPPVSIHRAEESAINRQRQARRDWERVERRNRERAAQQAQIDALEQERRLVDQPPLEGPFDNTSTDGTHARRYSSDSTTSSISILSNDSIGSENTNPTTHQNTQNTSHPSEITANTMPPTQSTDLDLPDLKDKILSLQQQSAIAAQNSSTSASKDSTSTNLHATPLSTYRCAICMDTPTTATTTVCGHVFCHTCLKDSLKWSAQQRRDDAGLHGRRPPVPGTGLCPVCRKVLSDKEGGAKSQIVGLEIRTMSRKDWERKRKQDKVDEEREEFLRSLGEQNAELDKGKAKEKDTTDYAVKTEDHSENQNLDSSRQRKGRFTRKRRRDEMGEHPDEFAHLE